VNQSENMIIILDTPENRLFLENLYDAINKLREKMTTFLTDPEKLLELIASNQKLLTLS